MVPVTHLWTLSLLAVAVMTKTVQATPKECKKDFMGHDYAGRKWTTKSGIMCQRWDSQTPHDHSRNDVNLFHFPDATLDDAANFCRNPDSEEFGPWCYTMNPDVRWEYCDVPFCGCKYTKWGMEYRGTVSVTLDGLVCQRWDSQSPHNHPYVDARHFPDSTLKEAGNLCRNPDGKENGPWCYTSDPQHVWQYCDVTTCDCKRDVVGKNYKGHQNLTRKGYVCQKWAEQIPNAHRFTDPAMFPDETMEDAANYCRNPDGKSVGPWCYTTQEGVKLDYCFINLCEFSSKTLPPMSGPSPDLECRTTRLGREYVGRLSTTKSGRKCQRWDSLVPHKHSVYRDDQFPDNSVGAAADFCRNPDDDVHGPWCFTQDPNVRLESCNIPFCECKLTDLGKEYRGQLSETKSGRPCKAWPEFTGQTFPDGSALKARNYCRNPDNKPNGPWCYTSDSDLDWEYCNVKYCGTIVPGQRNGSSTAVIQPECKRTRLGKEYSGEIWHTASGKMCQRWDLQTPHKHDMVYIEDFPDKSLAEASNYCRNPNNRFEGPWCHTTDPTVRWETCQISQCGCKYTEAGREYNGIISITRSGKKCQPWISQTPHKHPTYNPEVFPEKNLNMAANMCRNPDGKPGGPWCFTMDSNTEWEYCDVHFCECKLSETGTEYSGNLSRTSKGAICVKWDSPELSLHIKYDDLRFAEGIADAGNRCRNPDDDCKGPWCYTDAKSGRRDYCDIAYCDCKQTMKGQEFMGHMSETASRYTCQRWDSQSPHKHSHIEPSKFPDRSLPDASNFCRNPDGKPLGPWCYTLNPKVNWEYCSIPFCDTALAPKKLKSDKLSAGAVAAITCVFIIAIIVIVVAGVWFMRRRRRKRLSTSDRAKLNETVDILQYGETMQYENTHPT